MVNAVEGFSGFVDVVLGNVELLGYASICHVSTEYGYDLTEAIEGLADFSYWVA